MQLQGPWRCAAAGALCYRMTESLLWTICCPYYVLVLPPCTCEALRCISLVQGWSCAVVC